MHEIAQRAGLANDTGLRVKLEKLVELGYLEERRNVDAKPNEPRRYRIAHPAFRFHQRFVEPNLSLLERTDPFEVWQAEVEEKLPLYRHLDILERAAHAGHRWAHQALQDGSTLYYLSAAGFEEGFEAQVENPSSLLPYPPHLLVVQLALLLQRRISR